jgi:signal recognition particle GTPase
MFGLRKTLGSLFGRNQVDEAWFEHLEELLIKADVGVATTTSLITSLRKLAKSNSITNAEDLKATLIAQITDLLTPLECPTNPLQNLTNAKKPEIWLLASMEQEKRHPLVSFVTTFRAKVSRFYSQRAIRSELQPAISLRSGESVIKCRC